MINNLAIQQLNQQKQYQNVPVNGTANEIASNVQADEKSQSSSGSKELQQNPQPINNASSSTMTKKKKIIIIASVTLAVLIIVGTIIGVVVSQQSDDSNSTIKVPPTYAKYEKVINAQQEGNIVKIVHVPRAQLFYDYKLVNNQQTVLNGITKDSVSVIVHKIGLLCSDVSESDFTMYMYIMNTKIFDNDQLITEFKGFPDVIQDIQAAKLRRNLENAGEQNIHQVNSSFEQLLNEYNQLNDSEVEILKQNGVSVAQFFQSRFPIIKFTLLKDGTIKELQQPLNLRYDIHQVYLNILEQLAPKVKQDIYNVVQVQGNKTRVLQENTRKLSERILSGDIVIPEYQAFIEKSNGAVNLQKNYSQQKQNENDTEEQQSYTQNQFVEKGGVLESQANSILKLQDNKADGEQKQLFQKIQMNSQCVITFVSQQLEVGDQFLNQLLEYQSGMSVIKYTYDQAIKAYNEIFKRSSYEHGDVNNERNLEEEKIEIVQPNQKKLGETIKKAIFRRNFASVELGADIKSECFQSDSLNKDDLCNVGLYSQFNGNDLKITQKQVKFNVSKILKYYQFIVALLDKKIGSVNDIVNVKLENIRKALEGILDKTEEFLNFQSNPILKEINDLIINDELKIISQINSFEEIITTTLKNVSQFIENPMNSLKEKTSKFLEQKNIDYSTYANQIKDFVQKKYDMFKNFIDQKMENGSSQQFVLSVKVFIYNYDSIIKNLIEGQVQKQILQVQLYIQKKAEELMNASKLINDISDKIQDVTQIEMNQQLKDFLISSGIVDYIQKTINENVDRIIQASNIHSAVTDGILKSLLPIKTQIFDKMEWIASIQIYNMNEVTENEALQILEEMKQIEKNVNADLQQGFDKFQSEIDELTGSLKQQLGNDIKQNIKEYAKSLLPFPQDLIQAAIQNGKQTLDKVKIVGSKIQSNVVSWAQDIENASQIVVDDIKGMYNDLKELLKNPTLPTSDGYISNNSIYDDVQNVFNQVSLVIQANLQGTKGLAGIKNQIQRIQQLPNRFTQFIEDLKVLGEKSFTYFNSAKSSLLRINTEGQVLFKAIKELVDQARLKFKGQEQGRLLLDFEFSQLHLSFESLKQKSDGVFGSISQFDSVLKTQGIDVQKIFQDKMLSIAQTLEFNKDFRPPQIEVPVQYVQTYPTPVGISIKLTLGAIWKAQLSFNIDYKSAQLKIVSVINSQLLINGSVAGDAYVVQVGGYAEGTLLDAVLTATTKLNVLEKFKGNVTLDGLLKPFTLKMGIYYSTLINKEQLQCVGENGLLSGVTGQPGQGKKRQLWGLGTDWIKSSVNAVQNAANSAVDAATTGIKNATNSAKDAAVDAANRATQATKDAAEKAAQATKDAANQAAQAAAQAAKDAAEKAAQSAKDAANQAAQATKDYATAKAQAAKDSVIQASSGLTLQNAKGTFNCIKGAATSPNKVDLISPFEYKGDQLMAEKRLFEIELKGFE